MKVIKKVLFLSACVLFAAATFTGQASAQMRERVIKSTASRPTNLPPSKTEIKKPSVSKTTISKPTNLPPAAAKPSLSKPTNLPPAAAKPESTLAKTAPVARPALTDKIVVVNPEASEPLVKKTVSSMPTNAPALPAARRNVYEASTSAKLDLAIKERYGIRYVYGTTGPNTYDCSGFVWSAFQEAGINFTRASARSLWASSDPVDGDDRYKFGTLVFLNGLGHMGIVADENGFYHASSSKGITYSPFKGYWEKRIVGFRRLKQAAPAPKAK